MAKHRNQHFVPRCYLRAFSREGSGNAINLFHIERRRAVQDAPVRGQCARRYFYGRDLQIERAFQGIEGEYARVFEIVSSAQARIGTVDLQSLREFMFLQISRTKAAIQRTQQMMSEAQDLIHAEDPAGSPRPTFATYEMMAMTLGIYAEMREVSTDLKVCILKNHSRMNFITSDDPVVFSSMFHARKLKTNLFGYGSAGALFFLPLSPRLLLLCYDGDVYNVSNKRDGVVPVLREVDVYACNELQYHNAAHSVYFSDWEQRHQIEDELSALGEGRLRRRPLLFRFVRDGAAATAERYRRLDPDEKIGSSQMLISVSMTQIVPTSWLSLVRFRRKMRYYYDGSMAGHVRLHTAKTDRRFSAESQSVRRTGLSHSSQT